MDNNDKTHSETRHNVRNALQTITNEAEDNPIYPQALRDRLKMIREKVDDIGMQLRKVGLSVVLFIILSFWMTQAYAANLFPESRYQEAWCNKMGGVMEYRLDDGTRVDCVAGDYAVEVDFAPKFYEAIGQSLFYALKTGKQAGVVIILEKSTDSRYLDRLYSVARAERIRVWTITPADL